MRPPKQRTEKKRLTINDGTLAWVAATLRESPRTHGIDADHWTNARLRIVLRQRVGVDYSRGYIWEIAARAGVADLLTRRCGRSIHSGHGCLVVYGQRRRGVAAMHREQRAVFVTRNSMSQDAWLKAASVDVPPRNNGFEHAGHCRIQRLHRAFICSCRSAHHSGPPYCNRTSYAACYAQNCSANMARAQLYNR